MTNSDREMDYLTDLERRVLWLSSWTIHNANHLRAADESDVKVGGHQSSSASMATIMTALYFAALKPEDRVAVKPHASPIFHAIQYLAGNQTRENLENFRGFNGGRSYPSRTKDIDGHPATLAWLGSVHGLRTRALGVEAFGQTGTIQDLYRHHDIDAGGIMRAAEAIAPGRRIRNMRAAL